MTTNQEMVRHIDAYKVIQRTSDGYFDGSELLRQWNAVEGNPERRMSRFFEAAETKEFIKALCEDESQRANLHISENQLVIKSKPRNINGKLNPGKTWMHPILFIEFAMWINPSFKVKVIRFVYDQMIHYRNESGEAYKNLAAAIKKLIGDKGDMHESMKKIGEALNWIIFNRHEKMMRNKIGDEGKMRELFEFEKKVTDLINEGFIRNWANLLGYLRNQYAKKNTPAVLLNA